MIFFRNLWFFFWTDFQAIHKMKAEFYKMKAQVAELELFKRKLSELHRENLELKRLNRVLETKKDREEQFEEKASMRVKLNRWANEVEVDNNTGREIALMSESLEKVFAKIPRKEEKKIDPVVVEPKQVDHKGLSRSMR